MNANARPRPPLNGHAGSTKGSSPQVAEAERAYHDANAAHGPDSAEALVAWWHWREARRRDFEGRDWEAGRPRAGALGGHP